MFIAADASTIDMSAPWERLPDEQVQRLADIPVALIGDTRRRLGMMAAALRPVTRQRRIVGSVLPSSPGKATIWRSMPPWMRPGRETCW